MPALFDTAILLALAIVIRGVPLAYFLVRLRRYDALPWIVAFPFLNVLKQTFRFEAIGTFGPEAAQEYI